MMYSTPLPRIQAHRGRRLPFAGLLLFLSLFVAPHRAAAGPLQMVDQKLYGGAGNEQGTGIAVVDTGAEFAVYTSGTSDALDGEGLVLRYNLPYNGSAVSPAWTKTYPGASGTDGLYGIAATPTNVYAAGGSYSRTTDLVGGKEWKGITVNLAAGNGATVWERQTPGAPGAYAYGGIENLTSVAATIQGGQTVIYASGGGQSGFSNGSRLFVSKLDAAGNVLWTRNDDNGGGSFASQGRAVAANAANVFVAGFTGDPGTTTSLLRAYDASGGLSWSHTSLAGQFHGLTLDSTHNLLYAVGQTNGPASDFLIEQWDLAGNRLWSRTYDRGGSADLLSGVVLLDGRLFAAGSTSGGTAGGKDGALLEFDPLNGNLLGTTLWGGTAEDSFTGIAASANALHLVGTTRSFGQGGSDLAYVLYEANSVPEPRGVVLLGLGSLGWFGHAWRSRQRRRRAGTV